MTDRIRVLVADDHPLVRQGLRGILRPPRFEVVAVVGTGAEAVAEAVRLQPEVAVLDLQMPDMHGIEATREIRSRAPGVAVLVLTMFGSDESVFAAMRAGASGYLLKGAEQQEVLRAIEAVAAGEAIFSPGVATLITNYFQLPRSDRPTPFPELTDREREVLDLIAQGLNNRLIAERLSVSMKTVANHVSNIFAKLQVADRSQAIVRAREAGLGGSPDTPKDNGT